MSKELCSTAFTKNQMKAIEEQCPNCNWAALWQLIAYYGTQITLSFMSAFGIKSSEKSS